MSAQQQHQSFICSDCATIDLSVIPNLSIRSLQSNNNGKFIAKLGSRIVQPSSSRCDLCRLFSHVAPEWEHPPTDSYELRAFSFLRQYQALSSAPWPRSLRARDQICLGVVYAGTSASGWWYHREKDQAKGYLFCRDISEDTTKLFAPRSVGKKVDYDLVLNWLDFCNSYHGGTCGTLSNPAHMEIRVIDCETLSIVKASTHIRYAALSYVWGRSEREDGADVPIRTQSETIQLTSLSLTIRDAITVTKNLRMRYLWIDRYCIPQNDIAERSRQIQRMSEIYNCADLTIVAAAGKDEHYGLPGVSETVRTDQITAQLSNVELFHCMASPRPQIQASTWWKRGWTLQEGFLSRRRLVFTSDQVYFECNTMSCHESLPGDLHALHTRNRERLQDWCYTKFLTAKHTPRLQGDDVWHSPMLQAMSLIEQYTQRQLTYADDILNAYAGIVQHYALGRTPLRHVSGIPFPYSQTQVDASTLTVSGLLWYHNDNHDEIARTPLRRIGYPSWSWAGWHGSVTFCESRLSQEEVISELHEVDSGIVKSRTDGIEAFFSSTNDTSDRNNEVVTLNFVAPFIDVGELAYRERDIQIYMSGKKVGYAHLQNKLRREEWLLICLGKRPAKLFTEVYLLAVEQHGTSFSRIGLVVVQDSSYGTVNQNFGRGQYKLV